MKKVFNTVLLILFAFNIYIFPQEALTQPYRALELLRIAKKIFPEAVLKYSSVTLEVEYSNEIFPRKIILLMPESVLNTAGYQRDGALEEKLWEFIGQISSAANWGEIYLGEKLDYSWIGEPFYYELIMDVVYARACPYVYVYNGSTFLQDIEIIQNFVGKDNEATQTIELNNPVIIDNILSIKIKEIKNEISYIDSISIMNGNEEIQPVTCPEKLKAEDSDYLVLNPDTEIGLLFYIENPAKNISIKASGYYIPQ